MEKIREKCDESGEVLNEQSENEGYNRYKKLCYRYLILKSLLGFFLGLLLGHFVG